MMFVSAPSATLEAVAGEHTARPGLKINSCGLRAEVEAELSPGLKIDSFAGRLSTASGEGAET